MRRRALLITAGGLVALALGAPAKLASAQDMTGNNASNNMMGGGQGQPTGPPTAAGEVAKPDFMPGSRPAGMGQAFNALSDGTSGVFNNPAGIARAYMYSVDGTFAYTPTGNILSASIVDSKTNPQVAAGAGVGYYFSRGEGAQVTALDARLPIAVPVVQDRVSIGIAGRFLRTEVGEIETINGFSLDAGALFRVVDQLHVGIVGHNLIDPCKQATCRGVAPMLVGGGIAYATPTLAIAGDVEFDLNSTSDVAFNFDVGGEYLIAEMVPIRLGYRRLGVPGHNVLTLGSGWRSKTAGVDLAYQHNFNEAQFGNLFLGVSVYF